MASVASLVSNKIHEVRTCVLCGFEGDDESCPECGGYADLDLAWRVVGAKDVPGQHAIELEIEIVDLGMEQS